MPSSSPPMMVAADLENPAQSARHWKQPIKKAIRGVISSREDNLGERWNITVIIMQMDPVTNAYKTDMDEKRYCLIRE